MNLKELAVLLGICLVWGCHFVVLKTTAGPVAEPLFYAAVRMTLVALILSPLLKWHPGQMIRIAIAGACLGGLNYALLFNGVRLTNASVSAIMLELYVPIAMIFSVIFLKERIGLPRILALIVAFAGVGIIATGKQDGYGSNLPLGLFLLLMTAVAEALGAIFVKKVEGVRPLELMAVFAVVGAFILWPTTLLLEENQLEVFSSGKVWQFAAALAYTALLASIFGHTAYYWLLQRLDVAQLAPTLLLTTVIAVAAGIFLLGEPATARLFLGGALTICGVGVILLRNRQSKAPPSAIIAPVEN